MDRGVKDTAGGHDGPGSNAESSDAGLGTPSRGKKPTIPSHPVPFDYLFLMRPMILIPVWTFYLLGAYHGSMTTGETPDVQSLLAGFCSFTLLLGAVYIVNQIADRESDRANEKLFLVSHGVISTKAAWVETVILILVSFALGFIYLPRPFIIILALSAALGAAYSLKPLRLKARPVLDTASNAVGNGILNTLAGWAAIGAPLDGVERLLPYPFAVAGVHLATTIADIPGDRENSLRTSGTVLGERNAAVVSTLLMAAAVVVASIVKNDLAFYASLLSLPVFLVPARAGSVELIRRKSLLPAKWATIIFSIAAALTFRVYLIWLVVVVLVTRLYYEKRFSIRYPHL